MKAIAFVCLILSACGGTTQGRTGTVQDATSQAVDTCTDPAALTAQIREDWCGCADRACGNASEAWATLQACEANGLDLGGTPAAMDLDAAFICWESLPEG